MLHLHAVSTAISSTSNDNGSKRVAWIAQLCTVLSQEVAQCSCDLQCRHVIFQRPTLCDSPTTRNMEYMHHPPGLQHADRLCLRFLISPDRIDATQTGMHCCHRLHLYVYRRMPLRSSMTITSRRPIPDSLLLPVSSETVAISAAAGLLALQVSVPRTVLPSPVSVSRPWVFCDPTF